LSVVNKAFAKQLDSFGLGATFKSGLRFDLYGEYALTDSLGVDLTLMYTQKGAKYTNTISSTGSTGSTGPDFSYNYIALASSLRMYPGQDRQFCIFLGPYIGYLVSAKEQWYEDDEAIGDPEDLLDESSPEDLRPNRFDFGAVFGIDYEFDSGVLLGGYCAGDLGFSNIRKEDKNISEKSKQLTAQNASLRAFIGYNFAKLFT
jgi:opacity protein-like surface antigen